MSYYSRRMALFSGADNAQRPTAIALEAATGNLSVWDVFDAITVVRVQVLVTVAFDYDTQTVEGIVTFYKRVTYDSDTGRVAIGAVRLIHGSAIGDRLYADVAPMKLIPGQQIVAAITTAGVGGTELGDFQPEVIYVPDAENVLNITKMVEASA